MLTNDLIDQVSKTDNVVNKFHNEKPCGIIYKYIKYENGYLFKYVNNSTNLVLREKITFTLDNCIINGIYGNIV